jgi:hypothetical protein
MDSFRWNERMKFRPQGLQDASANRALKSAGARGPYTLTILLLMLAAIAPALSVRGDNEENNDEYQLNLNPHHPLTDQIDVFGNFAFYNNPDDYSKYRFGWPGLIYGPATWLQLWGGLDSYYTDNVGSADALELRPFAGVKLFVPNQAKVFLYNFTRYEYRAIQDLDTHDWNNYSRIRSRFGVEVPLTTRAKAWEPKTFYGFTDVEPFYRFDKNEWDPLRIRGGIGYVVNDRIRAEIIYTAQFTRSSSGNSLEYTDNILQLNIKIALRRGLLTRLFNPGG